MAAKFANGASDSVNAMGLYYWDGRAGNNRALAWGFAAVFTWVLLASTASADAVSVICGILIGLVLGQAHSAELTYGMGTTAVTAAVDPLDAAAAFLSVAMAVAIFIAISIMYRSKTLEQRHHTKDVGDVYNLL
jgi:uncharacterized membrane protein